MKSIDVVAICNALVDITVRVEEGDIARLGLTKGIMHLVDADKQNKLLANFPDRSHNIELGGSSLNALRAIAGMGGKTAFAGMIGKDKFGRMVKDRLDQLSITAHLSDSSDQTGTCAILVTPDSERTMNTNLGASRLFDESLVPRQSIKDAKIFHFCGYQWDTEGQKKAITQAIQFAEQNQCLISFDVADPFVVDRNRTEFIDLIERHADIVFANEKEALMLYGCSADEAARRISQTGAIAAVKTGAKGCTIARGNETIQVPARKTSVVDTTAAGDVFAGGFLYSYAHHKPLLECGMAATMLAADVISRLGTTVKDAVLAEAARL